MLGGDEVVMKTYTTVIEEFLKNMRKKADLNGDEIDLYEIIDFRL